MSTASHQPPVQVWRYTTSQRQYYVSTARQLISLEFVNHAFTTDDMPWARALSHDELTIMLDGSLTIAAYIERQPRDPLPNESLGTVQPHFLSPERPELEMVGMARFVTDNMTLLYLTDVYVEPTHRGEGLATFLVATCCKDIAKRTPALRRLLLLTSRGDRLMQFYGRTLGAIVEYGNNPVKTLYSTAAAIPP